MKKDTNIKRIVILQQIFENLQMVEQWAESRSFDFAWKYEMKAEGLIELLEVFDCGSTGGYDKGQEENQTLFDRFDWLLNKYNSEKDLKNDYGCTFLQLKENHSK